MIKIIKELKKMIDTVIAKEYKIVKKLGAGAFG